MAQRRYRHGRRPGFTGKVEHALFPDCGDRHRPHRSRLQQGKPERFGVRCQQYSVCLALAEVLQHRAHHCRRRETNPERFVLRPRKHRDVLRQDIHPLRARATAVLREETQRRPVR